MSYVLDALKKSETERQQGSGPDVFSIHTGEPSFRKDQNFPSRYLIWSVILLIVVIAGVGTLTYYYESQEQLDVHVQNVDPVVPAHVGGAERQKSEKILTTRDKTPRLPTASESKILVDKELQIFEKFDSQIQLGKDDQGNLQDDEIPLLQDLSLELRTKIPELHFSGHTFSSNPERRMIIVNNQILREGDNIDSLTTLKEITWEGIIVDFEGVVFRLENR